VGQISIFEVKFQFVGQILICGSNYDFWVNFGVLGQISIFEVKFQFVGQILICGSNIDFGSNFDVFLHILG